MVPLHGEYRQLLAAARLAEGCDPGPGRVVLVENGDRLLLDRGGPRILERIETGRVYLDGSAGEVDWSMVRDRRTLSRDGVVVPVLLLQRGIPPRVEVAARGFAPAGADPALLEEAGAAALEAVVEAIPGPSVEPDLVEELMADAMKRFLRRRTGRRPLVLPLVREV
jgi:ribonuclease J